jgi:ATPase subunit of ABC transporter with duplicated ATPase domains
LNDAEADGLKLKIKSERRRVQPLKIDGMEATGSTIVYLEDVGYKYQDDDNDYVFQNVDTCIDSKDHILLKGPNGIGKSTLNFVGHSI